MAELLADRVTKVDAGGQGTNAVDKGLINTPVYVITDAYTFAAAAVNDTLVIARLPIGAKVVGVEVEHPDLGSATLLSIGDGVDADEYLAATTVAAIGKLTSNLQSMAVTVATTDQVVLTVTGAAATGAIRTSVFYTL